MRSLAMILSWVGVFVSMGLRVRGSSFWMGSFWILGRDLFFGRAWGVGERL